MELSSGFDPDENSSVWKKLDKIMGVTSAVVLGIKPSHYQCQFPCPPSPRGDESS
ncbi:MAG: hypothetical protein MI975_07360 [Cytophagales bacterium]|nr:hypothetical protein [Cytophagales bacterium]